MSDIATGLRTEADTYVFLEQLRWKDDGPTECPHCGSGKGAWYLTPQSPAGRKSKGGSSARSDRRVWKCKESVCRRQFSVLTNTTLHGTKMPVGAWVGTVFDLCADSTGVSARDIAAKWGITEKSALSMLTRIEDALAKPEPADARLFSNGPRLLEVTSPTVDQPKPEPTLVKTAPSPDPMSTAEQVKRDVARALAEAFADEPAQRRLKPTPVEPTAASVSLGEGWLGSATDDDESASEVVDPDALGPSWMSTDEPDVTTATTATTSDSETT